MAAAPIWDGNGGSLDPRTASDHDLLIALHTKLDSFIIPATRDIEKRVRWLENRVLRLAGALALGGFLTGVTLALLEWHSMTK